MGLLKDIILNELKSGKKEKDARKSEKKGGKWLQSVKLKWHAPEGTFSKGSPEDIAKTVSQNYKVPLKTAISRISFFVNRAGVKLPNKIRQKCEKAKEILRQKYAKKEKSK